MARTIVSKRLRVRVTMLVASVVVPLLMLGSTATGAPAPCGRDSSTPLFVSHLNGYTTCRQARVVLQYFGLHSNLLFFGGPVSIQTSGGRWLCRRHVRHLISASGNEYGIPSGTCNTGSRSFAYRSVPIG